MDTDAPDLFTESTMNALSSTPPVCGFARLQARRRRSRRGIALLLLGLFAAPNASADFIWDGGGDEAIFDDPLNWEDDAAPPLDLGGQSFIFGVVAVGGGQLRTTVDEDYFNIGEFLFDSTNFNLALIGEGSFSFLDGASIINDSSNDHQFLVDVIGNGDSLIFDARSGDLSFQGGVDLSDSGGVRLTIQGDNDVRIGGVVSGQGASLLKQGAGNLTLSGDNQFDGGVELTEGMITLGNDNALGSGDLNVTGDSSLASDDDERAFDNRIFIDADVTLTFAGANGLEVAGLIVSEDDIVVDMDDLSTRVAFTGENPDFNAGVILRRGRVAFGNESALGSGPLQVEGDGELQALEEDLDFINDIEIDLDQTLTAVGDIDMRLAGTISGEGALAINMDSDEGRVTITGENTYEGGTFLQMGTLVFGDNDAIGDGDLILEGNANVQSNDDERVISNGIQLGDSRLSFTGEIDLELSGVITGDGSLRVDTEPDATLNLTGDSDFTGGTEVDRGRLLLTGSLASDVEVNEEGVLLGDGTISANLDVLAEGVVRPGLDDEPGGVLIVDGDAEFHDDGELRVRLDDAEDLADLLDVSGTVLLRDGSRIVASVTSSGYIVSGRSFTIIEADGGITDEGAGIDSDSATVTFRIDRGADFENGDNEFTLEIVRDADAYSAPAEGRNNIAIGQALDGLRFVADANPDGDAGDFLALLDALDAEGYNTTLGQISPARFAATDALVVDAARAFTSNQAAYLSARRAGFDRGFIQPIAPLPKPGSMASLQPSSVVLAQAIEEADGDDDRPLTPGRRLAGPRAGEDPEAARHGAYFRIYGLSNQQDATPNRTGFDAETFGGQVGYHYDLSNDFLLGVALSYGNTSADYDDGLGTLDSNSVRVGPYASWSFDRLYVDASLTFAYHLFDAERAIPDLDLAAESDYDGYELTGYLGAGYSFSMDYGVTLTPMASIQYSYFDIESFTESGAGGANLAVDGRSTDSLRTRLGLDASVRTPLDLIPYAFVGWEHEFFDEDESLSAAFVNGGPPFVVDFGSPGADRFFFGVGVNFLIEPGLVAYAHFENSIFDDGDIYAIAGGMRFNF